MRRTVWVLGAALILVAGVTIGGVALLDDSDRETDGKRAARAVAPTEPLPTTLPPPAPTTVAPTVPPTTPPVAPSTGDDRLSSNSRLGYAGLGPIKLGMTFAEVERAGRVTIRQGECELVIEPNPGSGLDRIQHPDYGHMISGFGVGGSFPITESRVIDMIFVGHPSVFTISGIHVGSTADDVRRTYANVVERRVGQQPDGRFDIALTITSPEGRVVQFSVNPDGVVRGMTVAMSEEVIENHRLC